jgi:hypothetical protein
MKPEYPEKTTHLPQGVDKSYIWNKLDGINRLGDGFIQIRYIIKQLQKGKVDTLSKYITSHMHILLQSHQQKRAEIN